MHEHIFIAIIAALVNLLLSVLVPCALKQSEQPLLLEVKKLFNLHRDMLLTSSVVTGVIVFLALQVEPIVKQELPMSLNNLMKLGTATALTASDK
jgi:hypothetical protein